MSHFSNPNEHDVIQPIRAWAEYDDWSAYAELPEGWFVAVPKGVDGVWHNSRQSALSLTTAVLLGEERCGQFHFLRVYLSNGYELLCDRREQTSLHGVRYPLWFRWELRRPGYVWLDAPHGSWEADSMTDSQSVARALDGALSWFV